MRGGGAGARSQGYVISRVLRRYGCCVPEYMFRSLPPLDQGTASSSRNASGTAEDTRQITVIGLSPDQDKNSTGPQ